MLCQPGNLVPEIVYHLDLGKDLTTVGEPAAFQDLDPFAATLLGGVFVRLRVAATSARRKQMSSFPY